MDQQALEKKFDAQLDPSDQRAWLERMSAEPNHVGAPHNKVNAEFMLEKFREWGWDAQVETFYVLFPTPTKQGSVSFAHSDADIEATVAAARRVFIQIGS